MSAKKRPKILMLYNPLAGDGLLKNKLDLIVERVQKKGYQIIPVRATGGKVVRQAMQEADPMEYRQIIVAGGDGTINVCVNEMLTCGLELPLAIFPTGTANDFAYYFSLPLEIEKMLDIALGEYTRSVDVGVCNDAYFINVAALGSLVDTSQKTDPNLKNTLGIFSYYLKGLTEIANLRPLPVTLITQEKTYEENMYFMLVMNGKSAGGFKKIAPESEVNDGLLDVILFREMPMYELGPLFVKVMQGQHVSHKNVLSFQTNKMRVESSVYIPTDVDGEEGATLPLEFSVLHKKLCVFTEEKKCEKYTYSGD